MNQTLYYLCRHCVGIMDGFYPYPARLIAEQTGVSISTARRRLRQLKKEGLVETFSVGPDDEFPIPYNGWRVTEKGEETEEYKAAWEKEKKLCREIFGPDMFPGED